MQVVIFFQNKIYWKALRAQISKVNLYIIHLKILAKSYVQKKGQKSNWHVKHDIEKILLKGTTLYLKAPKLKFM